MVVVGGGVSIYGSSSDGSSITGCSSDRISCYYCNNKEIVNIKRILESRIHTVQYIVLI